MKIINYFLSSTLFLTLLIFAGCGSDSSDTATNNNLVPATTDNATAPAAATNADNSASDSANIPANMTESKNGVSYLVHGGSNSARKAALGDFLTMHMQYSTLNDSVIFSSFNKGKPLSFKFQKTLFKGLLNEGIQTMGAGDSATFVVPADSLYKDKLPRFLKSGQKIKYSIALQSVQSEEQYQKEQEQKRNMQLGKDNEVLDKYLSENKIEGLTTTESGLRYKINTAGEGDIQPRDKVLATYKLTAVSPSKVVEIEDGSKKQELKIQTRGLREALTILKVGSKATLVVPSVIGFGERKRNKIPENSNLIYEIEINSAEGQKPIDRR